MSEMSRDYWTDYFGKVHDNGPSWIDYSNERVQLQTLGATLEVADRIGGKRVLDIGCGGGQLCRIFEVLGAARVVGIDPVPTLIDRLAHEHPSLEWRAGDFMDAEFRSSLGTFDVITLLEVMQYLPTSQALTAIWERLAPGGRIIAVIPNEACPIVQKTVARFQGRYVPPSIAEIEAWAASQVDCEQLAMRGLAFQRDQRLVPYELLPWGAATKASEPVPNRIQLVLSKRANAG